MLITAKFGGSSLADSGGFRRARDIILARDARRVVVVSAPGRRHGEDSKVTDLLCLCWAHIQHGVPYEPMLAAVESRFRAISEELDIDFDVAAAFWDIRTRLAGGAGEAYLISRGEALCARLMAAYLGFDYLDAQDLIHMRYDGTVDLPASYAGLEAAYRQSSGRVVIPGFYGRGPTGKIQLMSRGGSDITGAVAAAALGCGLYENWTDVPGVLMADPAIVRNPRPIAHITYDELRELTRAGARVFHEDSVLPVRQAGIPINIRDTGSPTAPGTLIGSAAPPDARPTVDVMLAITGKKGYSIVDIGGCDSPGWDRMREVLGLFAARAVPIEQVLSGAGSCSLVVPADAGERLYTVLGELESLYGPDAVRLTEGVALIACVCRGTAPHPGAGRRLFAALGRHAVGMPMVSQRPSAQTTVVGVPDEAFEQAVNIIYSAFTGPEDIAEPLDKASAWA